jgi:hypothetical protein
MVTSGAAVVRSGRLGRLDEQVAGHLEVERRAELGAVEREDPGPVGDERCVASWACSRLVMCRCTVSPSRTRSVSGVKWLRTAVM